MMKWTWSPGNQGIGGYFWDSENFEEAPGGNKKGVTVIWNEDREDFDATRNPWKIKLSFKNAVQELVEDDNPVERFVSGSLNQIRMYNQEDELLLRITGFEIPLTAIESWSEDSDGLSDVFRNLQSRPGEFIGSNNDPDLEDDYDEIMTGLRNDKVMAKGGDDFIADMGGKDLYNGGAGTRDTVSYDQVFFDPRLGYRGIEADLGKGKVTGFDGYVDTLKGIEQLRGTPFKDVMYGDKNDNRFEGLAGADMFDGRAGFDTVRYSREEDRGGSFGIRANLDKGFVRDAYGTRDTIKNIEGIDGTDRRDRFIDDNGSNYFRGRDGNDVFQFTKGRDFARGDDGADTFIYKGKKFGTNVIQDFDPGEGDKIEIVAAANFSKIKINNHKDGAIVKFGKNGIILEDVNRSDIDAGDFIF